MNVAAIPLFIAVVITVITVEWRWRLHQTRELKIAHALGKNVGMTVKELEAMRHPHTVYDQGRLTKFTCQLPAHLIGELADPGKRADVETKMKATIRGLMGHVTVDFDHARARRPHGTVTLSRAVIPKPIPITVDSAELVDTGRLVLPIGFAAGGRQIGWNIRPKGAGVAHALVYGATGSGKTITIQTLALAAMDRGHLVYVCDPKADDFEEWADQKICPVATDAGSITAMVAMVRRERERRVRDIRKSRRMNMLTTGELPSIVLVVDEMQALLSMIGWGPRKTVPAMGDLLNLAQQGRSAGIHLLVGTQYPRVDAVGGGDFRNQLELTVALGALKTEARNLTGITSSLTGYPPGRGIVSYPGTEIEVQVGQSSGVPVRPFAPASGVVDLPEEGCEQGAREPVNRGLLPPLSEEVVARIVALRGDGWSLRRIAAELEVSVAVVHKYASRSAEGIT